MRLATKLVLLYLVALLLIVGVFASLMIQRQQALAIAEHQRYATDLAEAMEPTLQQTLSDSAEIDATVLIRGRHFRHVRVRLIDIDRGVIGYQEELFGPIIVAEQEVTTTIRQDASGRLMRIAYVPLHQQSREVCKLEIAAPNDNFGERLVESIRQSLIALVSVSLLSAGVILVGGIAMVGRPLDRLNDKVNRVARGELDGPVELHSRDELGRLAIAINEMCDSLRIQRETIERETASRIATLQQLRHSDRLGSVGRMAAGIAHEIGTPLGVVSGRAELIASGRLNDEQVQKSAEAIKHESQRIATIVRQLLDFARRTAPHRTKSDLVPVVEKTLELVRPLAKKRGGQLVFIPAQTSHPAVFDANQIQQVLTNLIVNAVQSGSDIQVEIHVDGRTAEPPPDVGREPLPCQAITISDNGPGIAESELEHIFEPFFTTKDVGEGTGLGLSISYGIIREHGGWIDVESRPGEGSSFIVYLPVDLAPQD